MEAQIGFGPIESAASDAMKFFTDRKAVMRKF